MCDALPQEQGTQGRLQDEPLPPPKVILASVPRTGNTWMRFMLEESTRISTETVYGETMNLPVGLDRGTAAAHVGVWMACIRRPAGVQGCQQGRG